jgi:putative autotransporter adhesin-like protein
MFGGAWASRAPRWTLLALATLSFVAPACKKNGDDAVVEGSGVVKTEERPVPPGLSSLRVGGVVQATYTVGPPHLELRGDANLLPLIVMDTSAGRLSLDQERTLKAKMALSATIAGPQLVEIVAGAASRLTVEGIRGDRLKVRAGGAANLTIKGSVDELEVSAVLASQLDLTGLSVRKARVVSDKAARVNLGYVEELDVESKGVSTVTFTGDPKITRTVGRHPLQRR